MKNITFTKMVASGNDFVVVDNRQRVIKNPAGFTQKVCARHLGVGADGVLLFEKSKRAKFKMRIINSDGSHAEACGNGFRCIARFARDKLGYPKKFSFESDAGIVQASASGRKLCVQLPNPKGFRAQKEISVLGHRLYYSFINTGVPHAVIFVEKLSRIDVKSLGRAIRTHQDFRPKGTNVNFVEIKSKKEIGVRTYERGVENETLACGTGSTASAVISALLGYTKPPVRVKTSGGEVLVINFKQRKHKISNVTLEGNANFVYEGTLKYGG